MRKNCTLVLFDDDGNVIPNNITKATNDVIEHQNDAIESADAVDCTDFIDWIRKVVADEELWNLNAVGYGEIICRKLVEIGALATTEKPPYYYVPSADAEPTVVRCKTMIPYGDFREWAKRIREDNPNVIVIPFDAEVVSAEAIPHRRLIDADALIFELEEWKKNPNNDDSAVDLVNHFIGIIRATPSAEQVTSKLKNPCDSLLTDDSDGDKESKSKLDLISRSDAIEAVEKGESRDTDKV